MSGFWCGNSIYMGWKILCKDIIENIKHLNIVQGFCTTESPVFILKNFNSYLYKKHGCVMTNGRIFLHS